MKKIKNFAILLTVLVIVSCKSKTNNNFDYGGFEDNTYINNFFKIKFDLPVNWVIQSREQTEALAKKGRKLIVGDDDNLKSIIDASEINTANLLTAFKYEQGAAVDYNPNIAVVAENISNAPGIKTGGDYLFHAKKFLSQGSFKYDYLSENFENEKINGLDFYRMDASINQLGILIKQSYYSTIINGFSLNLIVSYSTEQQKNELLKSLNTISGI
ncbi:hypothetical protein [Tenacibaculum sp. IB213877]|uniref:hypothetical protein n=1 Tax=Tenacibaculum sp. IB213877 TaxID=3097351 RepID=UPI002A5A8E3C|nr:hypothetical protein [Tenacibaculum sp. IB213877]MDY0780484.1 hypothetical protein [Tenacibaculum sp. IB213877]